jgi:cell division protein FtsW
MSLLESVRQFLEWCLTRVPDIFGSIGDLFSYLKTIPEIYTLVVRGIFPILTVTILLLCILPLLQDRKRNTVWGYLLMKDGNRVPLKHWENSIGRSKTSDIVIALAFVSRSHAVLTFRNGAWHITDIGSKGGVQVNGTTIEKAETVNYGDTISLAGMEMVLAPPEKPIGILEQRYGNLTPVSSSKEVESGVVFALILLFQILGVVQISLSMGADLNPAVPWTFVIFILAEYLYFLVRRWCSRKYFDLELLCYFLCGLSLFIVASVVPEALYKQLVAILLGMAVYTVIEIVVRDLELTRKLKYLLVIGAIILLILNLVIGETHFGAKRWINLGFITFQPSEFVKIAFVMAGSATLDKLLTARNMTAFIGFSAICIGALVLMRDFGTVVVFFGAFIVIAFMRSGDVRTIALISAGAAIGAMAVISFMPYIASRFATWGNVWEFADTTGYQQTRTMIAAASGGLLGVGGGNGYLANVAAADTDLVFGILCEEWGLLIALMTVLIFVFFTVYAVSLTKNCRSSFYAIAACGAASILLIQTTLNVLGPVDILPLTGITMPFVSRGGSSMIASWGLLALIKSADDRIRPR